MQSDVGIGRAALLGLVAAGSTITLSIVRTKITAHYLGPAGVGLVAEILQLVALAMVPAGLFVGPALISQVASARQSANSRRQQLLTHTAIAGCLISGFLGSAFAIATGAHLFFPALNGAAPLIAAACVAALATSVATVPGQVLTGLGRLKPVALLSVVSGALSAVSVSIGTILFGLVGHLAAAAVGAAACVPIAWLVARKAAPEFSWSPRWIVDVRAVAILAKLGLSAFVAAMALQLSLSSIRYVLSSYHGPTANGLFQSAWALGGAYFGIAASSIAGFAFPRYAAAPTAQALTSEVDATVAFILRALPPILLAALALRGPILDLLYTPEFSGASDVLGLLIAGDFARAISWAQAGPLLYRSRLRAFLLTEGLAAALLILGAIVFVPRTGVTGVGYAYVSTYLAYMLATSFVLRTSCEVPVRPSRLVIGVCGTAVALALVFATRYPSGRWATGAAAVAWWAASGRARLSVARVRTLLRRLGKKTTSGGE